MEGDNRSVSFGNRSTLSAMGLTIDRARFYKATPPQMEPGPQIGDEAVEIVCEARLSDFIVRVSPGKVVSLPHHEDAGPFAQPGFKADSKKEYSHGNNVNALKDFNRRCAALEHEGFSRF